MSEIEKKNQKSDGIFLRLDVHRKKNKNKGKARKISWKEAVTRKKTSSHLKTQQCHSQRLQAPSKTQNAGCTL